MKFYTETVPKDTRSLIDTIKLLPDLQHFYLSGGTALSLLLGHRESEDLDFFTKTSFDPQMLQQKLLHFGTLQNVTSAEGTLNLFINKVKVQFLYYPYNLLEEFISWNSIHLSSVVDIACTKLITISMRGSKKDFIDLFVLLQHFSLQELFDKLALKYTNVEYNYPHILKSLIYFSDADGQPMPRMHIDILWDNVKEKITKEVKKITFV